jgi:uncharacterized protein (DUF1786 family)
VLCAANILTQRRRVVIKEYVIIRGVAKGGGTNGVEFKGQ